MRSKNPNQVAARYGELIILAPDGRIQTDYQFIES